ncbi:MAG: matrixin family metalloprotease [Vicinamibacterales bacterium]
MAAAALALVMTPALAQASVRVTDEALAASSAAAVQGRVAATSAQWDTAADTIYTFITIDVSRSWGLDGAPARVVVKQLGGVVGDVAFLVGGQARFEVGEEVLVFLDVRPRDRTLSVAGLEQGKWLLTGNPGTAQAATRDMRGHDQATTVARDYRSLATLETLAALAGSRTTAREAVLDAPMAAPDALRAEGPMFSLLSSQPARWQEADTATPVYVDSQAGGHPPFAGGGLAQLANAAALWSAAGSLRLQGGVQRSARCFSNSENDHRISVTYGDPCGEISDASSTLAIGGAYFTSWGQRVVNGVNYWSMTKGMIVVDNPPSKFASFTTGCYEEMLVHELGHAIGFGHASARPAIMYPSISSGCFSRSASAPLGSDDLAAMAAVYPGAGAPPPVVTAPGTPTGLTASVSGSTVSIQWNAPATGGAATGAQLLAGTAPAWPTSASCR